MREAQQTPGEQGGAVVSRITVQAALAEGCGLLRRASGKGGLCIDSPFLDASLLLASVLGKNRSSLVAAGGASLASEDYDCFFRLLQRRLSGECIAYILGKKEFRGLEFAVNPAVLVPRPDTEILVERALEYLDRGLPRVNGETRVHDLCTGSGAVAISLKHEYPAAELSGSDISAEALDLARTNAAALGVEAAFVLSDLFAAIPSRFSLITANPPYVPGACIDTLSAEVRREPRIALDGGGDGLEVLRAIIREAPSHLFPGGGILLETGGDQAPAVRDLLAKTGFVDIQTYRDLSGYDRVTGGRLPG
jgi:release factor glutamine methyltransferase